MDRTAGPIGRNPFFRCSTMTTPIDPSSKRDRLSGRIEDMRVLYDLLHETILDQLSSIGQRDGVTAKAAISKTNELQTALLLLTKAESEFDDKFGHTAATDLADVTAIRDDIRRALGRIRTRDGAGGISE